MAEVNENQLKLIRYLVIQGRQSFSYKFKKKSCIFVSDLEFFTLAKT